MIVHLATYRGRRSLAHVSFRGKPLGSPVKVVLYDEISSINKWPCGLYIFSDMERATPEMCELASKLHSQLQDFPGKVITLNHPIDHLKRFELLRSLYEQGVNDFNVHRATELDEIRYPAFLRYTDRHIGPSSGLLHKREELDIRLKELTSEGHDINRLIAVEYVDTSDENGIYYKYGALRVGPKLAQGHMFAGTDWMLKKEFDLRSLIGEKEVEFLNDFPYQDQIMAAFETSKLEYGRIDYSVKDGRVQVWEINDNPKMGASIWKKKWRARVKAREISRPIRRQCFQSIISEIDLTQPDLRFTIKS